MPTTTPDDELGPIQSHNGRRSAARRAGVLLAAIALLASVVVACSNESTKSSSGAGGGSASSGPDLSKLKHVTPPNPCPTIPGVTKTEIKVGGLLPLSGVRAQSFGPGADGIKARFAKANSEHELGDRKVTFDAVDDGSDPTRNLEGARRLVEQDHVYGIIEFSDQAAASAKYLNQKGIPVTGWHVGVPAWSIYPNMFSYRTPTAADPEHHYTTRDGLLLKHYGASKIAVVGGGNESSAQFVKKVAASVKKIPGMSVVYQTTQIQSGQSDFTAVVQRIKDSGADGMVTGMDFLQDTQLSDQLSKSGVNLKAVLFPGGYDNRVLHLPGIEGATFGLEFIPFELKTPSYQQFDKWMPKGAIRNQVTYGGWLSAEMFIEGLKQASVQCPTRKAFITNLRLVHNYTANGAFAPVDLTKVFGNEPQCFYYVQVKNAKFVPQFDGKPFCGKPLTY